MKSKKGVVITFRTDENTKARLQEMAEKKEWSISQVVEKICKEYFLELDKREVGSEEK